MAWKIIYRFRMATLKYLGDSPVNMTPLVRATASKKQIQNLQLKAVQVFKDQNKSSSIETNRLITSGMILDWKKFAENQTLKNQLLLKNGQNDQNVIFSYLVEEWTQQEPSKVIYRWIRRTKKAESSIYLLEEEHIYRGSMKAYHKHGKGLYLIVKRFSDNTQKQQFVKGDWMYDILQKGVVCDQQGNQRIIKNNMIHIRSNKNISAHMQQNKKVSFETQMIRQSLKELPPSRQSKSKQSFSSIRVKKQKKPLFSIPKDSL